MKHIYVVALAVLVSVCGSYAYSQVCLDAGPLTRLIGQVKPSLMTKVADSPSERLMEEIQGRWIYLENRCLHGGGPWMNRYFVSSTARFFGSSLIEGGVSGNTKACEGLRTYSFEINNGELRTINGSDACGGLMPSYAQEVGIRDGELHRSTGYRSETCGGDKSSEAIYVRDGGLTS